LLVLQPEQEHQELNAHRPDAVHNPNAQQRHGKLLCMLDHCAEEADLSILWNH